MPEILIVVIRSIIAFFVLLLMARLLGKTQVSQLTFFDYIIGITIGSIAASMSIDTSVLAANAAVGVIIWASLGIVVDKLLLKNIPARKLVEGEPTVLIRNGKIMEEAMARVHYNISELMTQLRNLKIFDISHVQQAMLETNGKISVLLKPEYQPVIAKDLNIDTSTKGRQPSILVVDGNIAHHRLKQFGLDEVWLKQQLKRMGIHNISNVMVAQLETSGELYVDLKEDWEAEQEWN